MFTDGELSVTVNSCHQMRWTAFRWVSWMSQDGCHKNIPLPVCLWIMGPHSRAPKKNTSHGNEVLPQDTICKLQWYHAHVSRSSGLAKTILQGTVKGGRRQGRQGKRWEDNIREWTGLESGKSQRAGKKQRKIEKSGCKIICGSPTTLTVKGLMMIMMMMMMMVIIKREWQVLWLTLISVWLVN